jgi:hypothetical protein
VLAEEPRLRQEGRWDQLCADLELLVTERNSGTGADGTLECE